MSSERPVSRVARGSPASPLGPLTDTEREILGYLAEMLTAEEIAVVMFIPVSAVRAQTRSILRKLAALRLSSAIPPAPNLRIVPT